MHLSV